MQVRRLKVLMLGGTAEARALAARLVDAGTFEVTTALAGVTTAPTIPAGSLRTGGFGGVEGLKAYLRGEGIAAVVDATHPFAEEISANAVSAAYALNVPLLRLERPAWTPVDGDAWLHVESLEDAVAAIPPDARAFVTTGHRGLEKFFARDDIAIVARMIEPPSIAVPGTAEILLARPPFTEPQERALMQDNRIDVLVAKNAGGASTAAKLKAARTLGLPVVMVARPAKADALKVATLEDAMSWLRARA